MILRAARALAFAASTGAAGLSLFAPAAAAFCLNPDALGVSRVLTVDTSKGLEVGRSQYPQTLGLQPHEVVLTFDDGPAAGTTEAVLKALDDQCVKATFFVVGARATLYPGLIEAEATAGHTIGTHSQNHPLNLQSRPPEDGIREIDDGIASVTRALGRPPAPFFRFPGLGHTKALRAHAASIGVGVFSIDAEGGDWLGFLGTDRIRARSIAQLKEHDGGILLLHDALRNTASMLPDLLRDLKAQGFKIVQIVPAGAPSAAYAAVAAATNPPIRPSAIPPAPPKGAVALAPPAGPGPLAAPLVTPAVARPAAATAASPPVFAPPTVLTTAGRTTPPATAARIATPPSQAPFAAAPAPAPAAPLPPHPTTPFLTAGED